MDTLKRVGSLRLSKRNRKQRDHHEENKRKESGTLLPEPKFYATLGRKEKPAKAFFTISFKDVQVSTLNGYQPTHLRAIFERHRKNRGSDPVLWEPSLKCTSTGSGIWHPPFVIHVAITVPKASKSSSGELLSLKQKDAFISIENLDLKGKRKLLAKARLNLSAYFESASETDVSFRLKLHPESSKINSASVDLTLRKSVKDPTKLSNADLAGAPCLYDDETASLGDDRILNNPSQKSLASSPVLSHEDVEDLAADKEAILPSETEFVKPKDLRPPELPKLVPNIVTPPPLPPRQRIMSEDSPPPLSSQNDMMTSTPMPDFVKAVEKRPSLRSHTPVKEIDWNDEEKEEEAVPSIGISLTASPKVSKGPSSKLSADKELMEWAKSILSNVKPQVKVTNLTSSWRNGLGFCLIIHQSYPHLIPLKELSADASKDNNGIAFDAADLLGSNTEAIRQMALVQELTDKVIVAEFLRQLQLKPECPPSPETVIAFQKKWYKTSKYFKDQVGHLCKEELEAERLKELEAERLKQLEAVAAAAAAAEAERLKELEEKSEPPAIPEVKEKEAVEEIEAPQQPLAQQSTPEAEEVSGKEDSVSRRQRARRLIALAHHESSSYDEATPSPPSSVELTSHPLCPSGTIMEELSQLAHQEEQLSAELEKLETALRNTDEDTDESDLEALLRKYGSMVNEKNSLVRRQMQLNIAEKERAIEHKKDKLQRQLQKFSDLDESQKTEAMRAEEENLLQRYVEAVNEKNELVHDLDSQEKLIAEDERIRSFIANRDILPDSHGHDSNKLNLMNEFLDFFKK